MTLKNRIIKTLEKRSPLSVGELAEFIGDYPVPSVRRTVREMEMRDMVRLASASSARPLRFALRGSSSLGY